MKNKKFGAYLNSVLLQDNLSTFNSTATPLAGNATYTGTYEDTLNYSTAKVNLSVDQNGTLYFEQSQDGVNLDRTTSHTITITSPGTAQGFFWSVDPRTRYWRLRYVNGAAAQGTFKIQTIFSTDSSGYSFIPLSDNVSDNFTSLFTRSVLVGKDPSSGTYKNVEVDLANQLMVTNETYLQSIAEGYMDGHVPHEHFGRVSNVNTSLTDIWNSGGIYSFPGTAQQMHVVSTSANDAAAGTGIRTITINGLDTNYADLSETVTLNGVTPVTTTNSFLRINLVTAITAGTGGVAAGTITIKDTTDTTLYGEILTGLTQSRQLVYTVPAGFRLFIANVSVSAGVGGSTTKQAFTTFTLKANTDGTNLLGIFIPWLELGTQNNSVERRLEIPLVFPEKTDMKMSVIADSAQAVNCLAAFRGWLDPN